MRRAVRACLRPALALRPAPLALLARSPLPAFGRRLSTGATGDAEVESLLDQWVGAKLFRNFAVADDLAKQLQQLGVDPHKARPDATGDAKVESLLDQWVGAKRSRKYVLADDLAKELQQLGVDPREARPDPRRIMQEAAAQGPLDAATEAKLDRWVAAKVARNFALSDRIRNELYEAGVDPAKVRQHESHTWSGGLSSSKGRGPFDAPTEALLDAWVVAKRARDYASSDDLAARLRAMDIEPAVARPPPGAHRRQKRGSAQVANPELGPFDFNTEEMLDDWVTARRP